MSQDQKSEQAKHKLAQMWAKLEWVWVLASPITKHRDSLLVMEDETSSFRLIPTFETKEAAQKLKPKLCVGQPDKEYEAQAISLEEVATFAAKQQLEIMVLDDEGRIMAQMSVQIEAAPVETAH